MIDQVCSAQHTPLTLHQLELPRETTAHSNIPHRTRLHDVMQSLHGLFDGRLIIEAVALQDIDVVKLKAVQRVFD